MGSHQNEPCCYRCGRPKPTLSEYSVESQYYPMYLLSIVGLPARIIDAATGLDVVLPKAKLEEEEVTT